MILQLVILVVAVLPLLFLLLIMTKKLLMMRTTPNNDDDGNIDDTKSLLYTCSNQKLFDIFCRYIHVVLAQCGLLDI